MKNTREFDFVYVILECFFNLVPSVSQTATPCSPRKFSCGDGRCVNRYYLCDGKRDCSDGRDEQRRNCKSGKVFNLQ